MLLFLVFVHGGHVPKYSCWENILYYSNKPKKMNYQLQEKNIKKGKNETTQKKKSN